jgi:hypothetical protein
MFILRKLILVFSLFLGCFLVWRGLPNLFPMNDSPIVRLYFFIIGLMFMTVGFMGIFLKKDVTKIYILTLTLFLPGLISLWILNDFNSSFMPGVANDNILYLKFLIMIIVGVITTFIINFKESK